MSAAYSLDLSCGGVQGVAHDKLSIKQWIDRIRQTLKSWSRIQLCTRGAEVTLTSFWYFPQTTKRKCVFPKWISKYQNQCLIHTSCCIIKSSEHFKNKLSCDTLFFCITRFLHFYPFYCCRMVVIYSSSTFCCICLICRHHFWIPLYLFYCFEKGPPQNKV